MALGKFERQLQLMLLLTQNRKYSLKEIGERLDISKRTIYRYLEFFKDYGFQVEKERDDIFRLDKSSSYFKQITELIHFTEPEAMTLKRVLEGIPNKTTAINQLLHKLSRIYDVELLEGVKSNTQYARNLQTLYQAAKEGRQCILKNYSSSHSGTVKDRLVEPFAFMTSDTEVRAYEIESKINKTYKISRIGSVELLEKEWTCRPLHKKVYVDPFQFTGDTLIPIQLRLDRLATNLLKEEIILQEGELKQEDEDHWIYTTEVCNFTGVGRFIMGLINHVQIIESKELKKYVKAEIRKGIKTLVNHKDTPLKE